MHVVVTGAGGFLGARVAALLLREDSPLRANSLLLCDITEPPPPPPPPTAGPAPAPAVTCRALDLTAPGAAAALVSPRPDVIFHLAAVVSGQAQADFELGFAVNFDATRALLEAVRHRAPGAVFVLASTVGVFGGSLPAAVDERTAPTPQSSYGAAKAMSELLAAEYRRRGWVDARAVRLPTVTVRAGAANAAVTSFASGVVREPLAGRAALLPVPPDTALWVCGPAAAARNLVLAGALPAPEWPSGAGLCLPGLTVTAGGMLAALRTVAGEAAAARVCTQIDPPLAALVRSFPSRFDASLALSLGFVADTSFEDIIRDYIRDDLETTISSLNSSGV